MMEQRSTVTEKWDRWSFLWLALAAIFALFTNGNWNIPLATWLSLLFALRFWRTQPLKRGFIIYTFVFMVPFISPGKVWCPFHTQHISFSW